MQFRANWLAQQNLIVNPFRSLFDAANSANGSSRNGTRAAVPCWIGTITWNYYLSKVFIQIPHKTKPEKLKKLKGVCWTPPQFCANIFLYRNCSLSARKGYKSLDNQLFTAMTQLIIDFNPCGMCFQISDSCTTLALNWQGLEYHGDAVVQKNIDRKELMLKEFSSANRNTNSGLSPGFNTVPFSI